MGRRNSLKYMGQQESLPPKHGVDKSAEDKQFIAEVLRGNPNLQRHVKLDDSHVQDLVDVAWREDFVSGQMLMSEGDLSNELFYIVAEGSFEIVAYTPFEIITQTGVSYVCRPEEPEGPVENRPRTARVAGRGLCIGDSSMVYNQPRLVTAQAREPSAAWAISQCDFKTVQSRAMQARREAGAGTGKAPEVERLLAEALRANANLQRLVPLSGEHIQQVVAVACRQELAEGHVLMYEGDLNAEAFYIVGEGSLEACGSEPFEVISEGGVSYFHRAAHSGQQVAEVVRENTIRVVGRGHCFGEISMLHCAPRFATLKALERTVLWAIDRSSFQIVQMRGAEEHMRSRVRYLEGLEAASGLPQGGRDALAGLMDMMRFTEGETIVRQGAAGAALHILCDGRVAVEVDGRERERLEADPSAGTHHRFGEEALRKARPHPATVRVASATATVLVLGREDFMSVWDHVLEGVQAPVFERLYTRAAPRKDEPALASLEQLGLLGVASFGRVELVRRVSTGETYALKTMSKGLVARRGMIASLAQERRIWEMVASPFVVRFHGSISEPQSYSLLLEAALGGQLDAAYEREGLYGSVPHARYYLAACVLALDSLHRLKVACRNLRPQSVLLSAAGQPKLGDMGLAKIVVGQTFTVCGAPNYMAPEVLAGTGHARAVDWWSLGVLAFELMAGRPPFESDHPMRVYWNVMRGIARVELPTACHGAVGDLVTLLLKPQAIERLPMRQGGISNITEHPWFAGFDWQAMQAQTLKPPYIPKLKGDTDLSLFSPCIADLPQPVAYDDQDDQWGEHFGAP